MTAAGGATLTTAHRVIDRVHGDAAVVRAAAEPALAAGLADADARVLLVRDLADRRAAVLVDHAHLARGQAELRVVAVLRHELRRRARRADELRALADLELD